MSPSTPTDQTTPGRQSRRREAQPTDTSWGRTIRAFIWLLCGCILAVARAAADVPIAVPLAVPLDGVGEVIGQWQQTTAAAPEAWQKVDRLSLTAGRYRFEGTFSVPIAGNYVIDFKNTGVLGSFDHELFTAEGVSIAKLAGGIERAVPNPFPQRHGRPLALEAGRYRLVTHIDSPFLLAQPAPYIDALAPYSQAIKPGNAFALLCLGIFFGLGLYNLALAGVRRDLTHALYAAFIAGNLLFASAATLVASDLFGLHSIYFTSIPILFSNIAYVWFVMCLLDIRRTTATILHASGLLTVAILAGFVALAAWQPHWSMELARDGVALFLTYGMVAGLWRSFTGSKVARWYLLASTGLFVAGWVAISNHTLNDTFTFHIEHLGLLAVTIEVLLLAFVLSHQVGELQRERTRALERAEHNLRLAMTDALTGLPNRYALEKALSELPSSGALTFIDLDGLKRYNDLYGHARGDRLLCAFARLLTEQLTSHGTVHRFGGDEFAITSPTSQIPDLELLVAKAIEAMRVEGYELDGASYGSAYAHECATRDGLKDLADVRMYENKRRRTEPTTFELRDSSPEAAGSLAG